jgi:HAD superfamily hydrolase (TIGR01509 family)
MNLKNIIFDLGGVLVGLDNQRCIDAFRKIGANDIAFYVEDHRTEDLFFDTEVGNISQEEFCREARRLSQCDASDGEIVWAWNQLLTSIPDYKKERLLQLHDRYRLFLLSNTNVMHWNLCADEFFPYKAWGVDDYFDRVFLSYEMHLIKPSADIFNEVIRQTGIKASETLFIDDSLDNCNAARKIGIQTLHETTGDDWISKVI